MLTLERCPMCHEFPHIDVKSTADHMGNKPDELNHYKIRCCRYSQKAYDDKHKSLGAWNEYVQLTEGAE